MKQDPAVQREAAGVLESLFRNVGQSGQDPSAATGLAGLGVQISEFITMPVELAEIFADMSIDLTKMVLESLAQAGYVLVKGLTPM